MLVLAADCDSEVLTASFSSTAPESLLSILTAATEIKEAPTPVEQTVCRKDKIPDPEVSNMRPNELRVAQDRSDCCLLYVVTDCTGKPRLGEPISDPAMLDWGEVPVVAHFTINTKTLQ